MKLCSIDGCNNKHRSKGYCKKHYMKLIWHPKNPVPKREWKPRKQRPIRLCSIDGCENKHYSRGYCRRHYMKYVSRKGSEHFDYSCMATGCKTMTSNGLFCTRHMKEYLRSNKRKGENNPKWNGGIAEYPKHSLMKRLRLAKLQSVNFVCEKCGGKATEIHHKDRDKSHHEISNFVAVCHRCHIGIFHRHPHKRKYSQYSLAEMAVRAELSIGTVVKYFRGEPLKQSTIAKIESFLNHQQAVGE